MTSPSSVLLSDLTLKLFPAFLPSWPQAARIRIQPSQPAVVTYLKVPVANVVTVVTVLSRDFKIGHYGRLGRLDAYTGGLGP